MITSEQIQRLVSALRSRTKTSIRENQLMHLPIIYEGQKTARVYLGSDGDTQNSDSEGSDVTSPILRYYENNSEHIYNPGLPVSSYESSEEESSDDEDEEPTYFWQYNYLVNMKKYHYNEKWYSHIDSVDYPERSFGIIRVDKMPYRTFEYLMNKKSFVCRLDRLIYDGLCEPVMLFIDRKFINWYNIDVVHDCGDTYMLIHGTDYTYYKLKFVELHLVVLPFSVDFIGTESDDLWQSNYDALSAYLQASLYLNESEQLMITVPTTGAVYESSGMIYGVGAWMYTQMRMYKLGMLSDDRIALLRKINLTYYEYDDSGNVSYSYITKFNALDKDNYDKTELNKVCHMYYEQYEERALFRFTEDGVLDQESGPLIIALMDESLYTDYYASSDKYIYCNHSQLNQYLFRENYLVFKDGLINPECTITQGIFNAIRVSNDDCQYTEIFTFCPDGIEVPVRITDPFRSPNYLVNLMLEYLDPEKDLKTGVDAYEIVNNVVQTIYKRIIAIYDEDADVSWEPTVLDEVIDISYEDAEYMILLGLCQQLLDYEFTDDLLYSENQQNGFDAIMDFDPKLFNGLYHTQVKSKVLTGAEVNEKLTLTYGPESRRGLKIPRYRYHNHETYVMVFVNGELIDTYYKMIAFANFFLIPLETELFAASDVIEILFYIDINNNEITFQLTENILDTCFTKVEDDNTILKVDIFDEYIRPEELKLFCGYPTYIMDYPELVQDNTDYVAFNVSFRDDNGDLYAYKDAIDPETEDIELIYLDDLLAVEPDSGVIPTSDEQIEESKTYDEVDVDNTIYGMGTITTVQDISATFTTSNLFTAVSSRKFVYQRLYVDQVAYRIKIHSRFRFCDNQKQYMLFINGRRIEDEGFLITIPKFTRPFWAMYLYTAKFVTPEDRIELFYVPYEVLNVNTEKQPVTFKSNGYIEVSRQDLEVPYDAATYTYFINGKKIPSTWLIGVDTHTLRVAQDTKSLKHLVVNKVYRDTIPEVVDYLQGSTYSKYDALIKYIKEATYLGYDTLDTLFNTFTTMHDSEEDMIAWDTGPIAIINEIVRDFWVTSGYQYNDVVQFIYDYALDEYIELDEDNNLRVLPALDARQHINIFKNDIYLLYFIYDPEDLNVEIGSTLSNVTLEWAFSTPLYGEQSVLHQYVNDEEIDVDLRIYTDPDEYDTDVDYEFKALTTCGLITRSITYHFCNGIYYGNVDEDSLQWFWGGGLEYIDDIFAVRPNNQKLPSSAEQALTQYLGEILMDNTLIYDITYEDFEVIPAEVDYIFDDDTVFNLNDPGLFAICEDGEIISSLIEVSDGLVVEDGVIEYFNDVDMQLLTSRLQHKVLQDGIDLDLTDYVIGSNNYFVFAAPYERCFDADGVCLVKFTLPDLTSDEVKLAGVDDHTTPIYTDGRWDRDGQLIALDTCEMVYLGKYQFTNSSGYTETYCAWRTNGFFTRQYDDYGVDISIRSTSSKTSVQVEFTAADYSDEASTVSEDSGIATTSLEEETTTNEEEIIGDGSDVITIDYTLV